ncbi:ABC transporter permease [Streptomyces sp. Je 1-79]|uniref:ABC transporter permease n=1 Tax=Streptomyces sp. Je 1-79 TaxID=2943847 RepID=UPI0021A59F4B|nr:ABC transporter permease [Streptomyces sp. Je 1-79]MCT4356973.1 ABC transporter permease [Streptomyces sp. Je 1-79]
MSRLALKGPYWLTARQHRRAVWAAAAATALSLAVLAGLRLWDAASADTFVENGHTIASNDNRGFGILRLAMEYAGIGMVLLPLVVGAFVAGPLIARELESGTYRLALTQSFTPVQWFRAKVLTAAGAALAATLALLAIYRIGWGRVSGTWQLNWSDRGPYEATGTVLVAYVLLAVAVGALLGQLVRRTVVAMAATGLVTGLVLAALGALRWDFLPVRTVTGPLEPHLFVPRDGLMMDTGMINGRGERLPEWICFERTRSLYDCPADLDIAAQYVDYHPESHFWPTQLIETGIVLALAALALFAAFRVLRARHR